MVFLLSGYFGKKFLQLLQLTLLPPPIACTDIRAYSVTCRNDDNVNVKYYTTYQSWVFYDAIDGGN